MKFMKGQANKKEAAVAKTFFIEIVTPRRTFFSGDVEMVVLKTPDGELGILPGHIPMVVAVDIGPVRLLKDGKWSKAVLNQGFMEIQRDHAIILADSAEWPHEIDVNRALAAQRRAEERLHRKISRIEYKQSQAALTRALARLKISREITRK